MKRTFKLSVLALLMLNTNYLFAQWDGSAPPVNTYTQSNVGIGTVPGPVSDARLHILTNADPASNYSLNLIPGFLIQRNLYTSGFGIPPNVSNIMEIWSQHYPSGAPSFGNQLKFVVDNNGQLGLNKKPGRTLDVGGEANIDGSVTIGEVGAAGSPSSDMLTVNGNMTLTQPVDSRWRYIRSRSNSGVLYLAANTESSDGSTIELSGPNASGREGQVRFISYGPEATGGGVQFWNFDPTTTIWRSHMRVLSNGKVAIGPETLPTPGDYKLYVDGGILTQRIKVALPSDATNWSDFVFDNDYELMPLCDVEKYIEQNNHLPEIPSTAEVHKEGLDLAQMDAKLLQKVEELTLYLIQQQKEIEELRKKLKN
ncbi:hypothetical protein F0919_09620 [Taibaiella lutea]|uniref:BZIP transcription factor n=1 Tax=Taibaiella lutea TaxID=2608001 RepID=A0A5M6CI17_9BACT|nr:hypothetical protein [Taibaiella lutea]KAA5534851.1 hypothetical protein F0919_09620 [Taibaiella lutea]